MPQISDNAIRRAIKYLEKHYFMPPVGENDYRAYSWEPLIPQVNKMPSKEEDMKALFKTQPFKSMKKYATHQLKVQKKAR